MPSEPTLSLRELLLIFLRVGATAWGGGGSTFVMLHSEFCVRRKLLSEDEFQLLFALARVVPGMNLLALAVLLGHKFGRFAGAVTALAGLSLPCFSIIVLLSAFFRDRDPGPVLRGVVQGLTPAAVALLLHLCWTTFRTTLVGRARRDAVWSAALAVVVAIAAVFSDIHPAWFVLVTAWAGAILFKPREEEAS